MGNVYKNKKSSGCALCKPRKHGKSPKFTEKEMQKRKLLEQEIEETLCECIYDCKRCECEPDNGVDTKPSAHIIRPHHYYK